MFLVTDFETVFRRSGRRSDEFVPLGIRYKKIEGKLRRRSHDGPRFAQILLIAAERIVFPEMLAHPWPGQGEKSPSQAFAGRGVAPGVVNRVDGPAACAVVSVRGLCAGFDP